MQPMEIFGDVPLGIFPHLNTLKAGPKKLMMMKLGEEKTHATKPKRSEDGKDGSFFH